MTVLGDNTHTLNDLGSNRHSSWNSEKFNTSRCVQGPRTIAITSKLHCVLLPWYANTPGPAKSTEMLSN